MKAFLTLLGCVLAVIATICLGVAMLALTFVAFAHADDATPAPSPAVTVRVCVPEVHCGQSTATPAPASSSAAPVVLPSAGDLEVDASTLVPSTKRPTRLAPTGASSEVLALGLLVGSVVALCVLYALRRPR